MSFTGDGPVPMLILGDAPDKHGGLSRICHDLAWLISEMPEFRLGVMGRQAFGRSKFPWAQYSFSEREQWGEMRLKEAWEDLSQGQRGVIFTLWDASRLLWFTNPTGMPEWLQAFLTSGAFERWGYFMQDSEGTQLGQLPLEAAMVMTGFNRVCLASRWASTIARQTIQHADMDWIPHGINTDTFKPVDRLYARSAWGIGEDALVVGCVMANQARKDWPVVLEAMSRLEGKPYLWLRTDLMQQYWNLLALIHEYGLDGRVLFEDRELSDKELAMRYSACDVTVMISGGEGFCYPVAESLACGVSVVTGSYGAQAELGPTLTALTGPVAYRIDTLHNVRRAVYAAEGVAKALAWQLANKPENVERSVAHLDWRNIGHVWRKWLRRGLCASV